ncbi:MAG: hypothetical protein GW802_37980, partial [Armatimonadetes bacterium]|nr:hypothetical protein [Armatimonadota bacterium]
MKPGLQWAQVRRLADLPQAHASLLVDYFQGRTEVVRPEAATEVPEVYGLSLPLCTEYREEGGCASWRRWVSPTSGEKPDRHLANTAMTEWLATVHEAILRAAAALVADDETGDCFPAVGLTITPETTRTVEEIHEKCDWVIALDRHLGVEYFDQPHGPLEAVYEKYLLDYVPAA